jgi:hypothetical protein
MGWTDKELAARHNGGPETSQLERKLVRAGDHAMEAALSDWIAFILVPAPKAFAIYADHDENTTLRQHEVRPQRRC